MRRGSGWAGVRSALLGAGLLLILVVLLIGLPLANRELAELTGLGEDLLPLWLGARVGFLDSDSPYQAEPMIAAYRAEFEMPPPATTDADLLQVDVSPPGLLLGAATMMAPYPLARALWLSAVQLSLALLLLVGLAFVGWRPPPVVVGLLLIVVFLWRYGLQSMLLGTSDPLVILLVLAGLWMVARHNEVGAVVLLTLATVRPELSLLAVAFAWLHGIFQRRWVLALGLPVLTVFLWGSLIAWHPEWFAQWLGGALANLREGGLNSPLGQVASGPLTALLALPVVVLLLWAWLVAVRRGRGSFLWTSALTLTGTAILLAPAPLTPALLTVPSLLLSFKVWTQRWTVGGAIGAALVGALLIAAPWLSYGSTEGSGAVRPAITWLPVVLSAISLFWIRWWVVDQTGLSFGGGPVGRV